MVWDRFVKTVLSQAHFKGFVKTVLSQAHFKGFVKTVLSQAHFKGFLNVLNINGLYGEVFFPSIVQYEQGCDHIQFPENINPIFDFYCFNISNLRLSLQLCILAFLF